MITTVIKIVISTTLFFVWVVRYNNIQKEFEQFNLPKWLRDVVGILKISFALMMHSDINTIILIGSGGISLLMIGAIFTHFRVNNKLHKMLPALTLFSISMIVSLYTL